MWQYYIKTKQKNRTNNDLWASQDKEEDVEEKELGQRREGKSGEEKEEEDRG